MAVTIDFIARGEAPGEWRLVLVEAGPWAAPFAQELRRVQGRLYDVLDVVMDGAVAAAYPESRGQRIVIELDAYDCPNDELSAFFDQFSKGVLQLPDYAASMANNPHVSGVALKLNLDKRPEA